MWKWGQVWDIFIKWLFSKHLHFEYIQWCFFMNCPFFLHGCKHPLFYAFSTKIGLIFRGHFCINLTGTRKKVSKFISIDFFFKNFFPQDFLKCQNLGLYFRKLFFKELLWWFPKKSKVKSFWKKNENKNFGKNVPIFWGPWTKYHWK